MKLEFLSVLQFLLPFYHILFVYVSKEPLKEILGAIMITNVTKYLFILLGTFCEYIGCLYKEKSSVFLTISYLEAKEA